ncbi:hypothetical protein [Kribbella swartbergensis]
MRRFLLLLVATVWLASGPAWAAVPADPRVTAAVAAWRTQPLYVDPDYESRVNTAELLRTIEAAPVPVYVAVVPTGQWFPEEDDTALLGGWMAAANDKPGLYVVMDGDRTYGVEHEIAARGPEYTWADSKETMSSQLAEYLGELEVGDRYAKKPARTEPLPPRPERTYPEERFTVGKAIGNGVGGGVLGLMGGALLAGVVLAVAALVGRGRGGTQ